MVQLGISFPASSTQFVAQQFLRKAVRYRQQELSNQEKIKATVILGEKVPHWRAESIPLPLFFLEQDQAEEYHLSNTFPSDEHGEWKDKSRALFQDLQEQARFNLIKMVVLAIVQVVLLHASRYLRSRFLDGDPCL